MPFPNQSFTFCLDPIYRRLLRKYYGHAKGDDIYVYVNDEIFPRNQSIRALLAKDAPEHITHLRINTTAEVTMQGILPNPRLFAMNPYTRWCQYSPQAIDIKQYQALQQYVSMPPRRDYKQQEALSEDEMKAIIHRLGREHILQGFFPLSPHTYLVQNARSVLYIFQCETSINIIPLRNRLVFDIKQGFYFDGHTTVTAQHEKNIITTLQPYFTRWKDSQYQ